MFIEIKWNRYAIVAFSLPWKRSKIVAIHVHTKEKSDLWHAFTVFNDAPQKLAKCYKTRGIGCGIVIRYPSATTAQSWIISLPMVPAIPLLSEHKEQNNSDPVIAWDLK